jgi:uncharacterized protein (TIGR02996 family)
MTDRESLLSAALDQRDDDTARLVLADFLREQGDPADVALGRFLWAGVVASRYRSANVIEDPEFYTALADDDVIAERIGRSPGAVTSRRVKRKIPAFSGWPGGGPGWTAGDLALLGTADDEVIAHRIGRTVGAVMQKRQALKIRAFRDRRRGGR